MDITQSNLDIVFRAVDTRYQTAFDQAPNHSDKLAFTLPAKGRKITFATLDRFPRLKKWVGNRIVNSVYTHSRDVTIELFEDTVGLDKFDMKDDQFGIFNQSITMLGEQAKKWTDDLIFNYIL